MSVSGSPPLFTRWAGIFALAAAMEQKVWIKTRKGVLYPNMYTVMVGPPGAGKTLATGRVRSFLQEIDDLHVAPSSVTKASLIDGLDAAKRKIITREGIREFNSLTVVANELSVFLPAYDSDFMGVLTDIWDCLGYSETRRSSKISIDIKSPQFNLAAATTPSYLNQFLPEGAWDQGFLSRTLLIYSGASVPDDIFGETRYEDELDSRLRRDLSLISKVYGKMEFSEEAAHHLNEWHKSYGQPAPTHPKLTHYLTRRTVHLLKLCMIASISESSDLIITLDHYAEALNWLTEAEHQMEDIFKAMKTGGDSKIIEEAWHYLYTEYAKNGMKEPISQNRMFNFLQQKTPAHNVERIAKVMVLAGLMQEQPMNNGTTGYKPLGRN